MAQNDITDIQPKNVAVTANTIVSLPIRGEKRIIPSPVSGAEVVSEATKGFAAQGITIPSSAGLTAPGAGFNIEAARATLVDYVMVRVLNRGTDATGTMPDPTQPMVFRFLINPETVQVTHNTLDSQTLTRSGWQFGVWGEDIVKISMQGQTAGRYFAYGLTDAFAEYSESYRNLTQLQLVFENNGYWFEGEQLGEGPLAAGATRRRIKMHNDVQLIVGDFIWYGCFENLSISQDAENPFIANFNIEFMAWKERFRSSSPYFNNIENNVQRGASYSVYSALVNPSQQGTPSSSLNPGPAANLPAIVPPLPATVPPTSPAVTSDLTQYLLPTGSSTELDSSPSPGYVLGNESFFLG